MKTKTLKGILTGCIGLISLLSCHSQRFDCELSVMENELLTRYNKDQEIRNELIPVAMEYQKSGKGAFKLLKLANRMERIDSDNQEYLEKLFTSCGWQDNLSRQAHNAIFMIIQHADLEFMNTYIEEVRKKSELGLLDKDDYAIMLDRRLMYQGEAQLFGSQTFQGTDKKNYIWPISNPEQLPHRRDSVGLPNMEKYLAIAKDSTGIDIIWDKTLKMEDAKKLKLD
ncbi:DUF6624 domain-containing protein [Robertkochia flava]|uniref:DUF6624 domain-containing protein n=1 Tax=Robertkochia flava TaxID=3447986 RepID=UPI001CCB12BE|nr:DUF6624 domain-containing protein [Robertkochia marina]